MSTRAQTLSGRTDPEGAYDTACNIALDLSAAVIGFGISSDGESFVVTLDKSWSEPVDVPPEILGVPVAIERRSLPHIPADPFA